MHVQSADCVKKDHSEDTDLQYIENVPVGFAHKRSRGPAVESEPMLNRCNRHSEKS